MLASGNGTNFEFLAQHFKNNDLPGELALLFCNQPDAPVMKRSSRLGIPAESFTVKSCRVKQEYDEKLLGVLKK
ncbi:formyltransferase family protein, partial [Limosilactobacillus reuteri]|uniref:formyltransferase family protein n=1 Tax=Limosilactobacillus reuteri TaxID=1598 RepID=UPI0021E7CD29